MFVELGSDLNNQGVIFQYLSCMRVFDLLVMEDFLQELIKGCLQLLELKGDKGNESVDYVQYLSFL